MLHCDARFNTGQSFTYLTKGCNSAGYYVGNRSAELPSMRELAAVREDEIPACISAALGCPASRLARLKSLDKAGYRDVTDFWQLLTTPTQRLRLGHCMRQHAMGRGDMVISCGPLVHFGAGCPAGTLRLVVFKSFAGKYNDDSQVMRYMLAMAIFEWQLACREALLMHWRGGDPASHFSQRAPEIAAALTELVAESEVTDPHDRDFIQRHGLRLFRAYVAVHTYLKPEFDSRTGRLLSELPGDEGHAAGAKRARQ